MNGGPLSYTNNNSDPSSVNENGLKAQSPQSPEATNGVTDSLNQNGSNGVGPLHIPAKRVTGGGHWTSPSSAASNSTTASSYSTLIDNNSSVAPPTSVDPLMAVSAASPYPTSHYSSLAASVNAEAVRRATPTGMTDTKPGLSFWQNDYHKYAAASAASVGGASVSTTQSNTTSPSAAASIAATEPCQMTTAAGFAAQQAAAWNYPHPSHYAAALTSPEQAAAEAARARQMAADSAGFHAAADYTRLQYPPDGIYTHPPGTSLSTHAAKRQLTVSGVVK